jgi:hypothetical protein
MRGLERRRDCNGDAAGTGMGTQLARRARRRLPSNPPRRICRPASPRARAVRTGDRVGGRRGSRAGSGVSASPPEGPPRRHPGPAQPSGDPATIGTGVGWVDRLRGRGMPSAGVSCFGRDGPTRAGIPTTDHTADTDGDERFLPTGSRSAAFGPSVTSPPHARRNRCRARLGRPWRSATALVSSIHRGGADDDDPLTPRA